MGFASPLRKLGKWKGKRRGVRADMVDRPVVWGVSMRFDSFQCLIGMGFGSI